MICDRKPAPKSIPHRAEKLAYIIRKQNGLCAISVEDGIELPITDLHHTAVHNNPENRRRFPLFIHSIWNLSGVNNGPHTANPSWGRKPEYQIELIEEFLEECPPVSRYVNTLTWEE